MSSAWSVEDGAFTGNRRFRDQAHEIPGVSPAIITRLLHNSIFLNLKDLEIELPPYVEEVVELEKEVIVQSPLMPLPAVLQEQLIYSA